MRYLKGSGPSTVKVRTAATFRNGGVTVAEDGIEPRAGEIWKIYSDSRQQPFDSSICGGSTILGPGEAAVALWSGFPASVRPRPIVTLSDAIVNDPRTGFPDGKTKTAYIDDRFLVRVPLPKGPGRLGSFPVISATDAYHGLYVNGPSRSSKVPPLVIRSVHLGIATFRTDRGRRRLPAWRFWFKHVSDPASVLAVAPPSLFSAPALEPLGPPGTNNSIEDSATADRSDTAITISFIGAPPGNGPCGERYRASAVANRRAVGFTIHTIATAPSPGTICATVGYPRNAVLHLSSPLGDRALISSSDAGPVAVTR
jgi:hypothetical protein